MVTWKATQKIREEREVTGCIVDGRSPDQSHSPLLFCYLMTTWPSLPISATELVRIKEYSRDTDGCLQS